MTNELFNLKKHFVSPKDTLRNFNIVFLSDTQSQYHALSIRSRQYRLPQYGRQKRAQKLSGV